MKKTCKLAAFFAIIICTLVSMGCSSQPRQVDLNNVMKKIDETYKIENTEKIEDKSKLKKLYQIDEADVESFAAEVDEKGMNEIILIKAVDSKAAERISGKLQIRLSSKKSLAASYDAETLHLIKKCKVMTNNDVYVNLIVANEVDNITETYGEFFR